MTITNTAIQITLLERISYIEAGIHACLELQAIENEAIHMQLHEIMKLLCVSVANQGSGTTIVEIPEIPQISLMHKYQEYVDTHQERIAREIVTQLRQRSGEDDLDESMGLQDLTDYLQ